MALKLITRKDGGETKEICVGCMYDKFENWKKAYKDYCYLCDSNGSERVHEKLVKED